MTALFINLRIDNPEKFALFKVTIADLSGIFDECHIKIRGRFSTECVQLVKSIFKEDTNSYQSLQSKDWIATTLDMLSHVKSRSIFFYIEDHKLVAATSRLKKTLKEFDKFQLDYLSYSFFRASNLSIENLLPMNPKEYNNFSAFNLNKSNLEIIGKISNKYHTYSLTSMASVNYFRKLLELENKKIKIYQRKLIALLCILMPYPKYRKAFHGINRLLSKINIRFCIHPPDSPFNLEKTWYEHDLLNESWKFAILKEELFANFDDDNGAYGESLIKRGLYPFDDEISPLIKSPDISFEVSLRMGEIYNCKYYNHWDRITNIPKLKIIVLCGELKVNYKNQKIILVEGDTGQYYSNLISHIECVKNTRFNINIYDSIFN